MLDPLEFQMEHRISDLRPRGEVTRRDASRIIFERPRKFTLSSARLLENLYMVATRIRPSSMFHPESIEEIVQVHEIAKELGSGMVVRKCGKQVYKVFLFSRKKEELAFRIPDLYESMGFQEFILAQITIANLTGDLLDFPGCCVRSFVRHLMNGSDQDLEAHDLLRKDRSPDPRAYFVERFVPCGPHCKNAVAEGERVEKGLHVLDRDLEEEYITLRSSHLNDVRNGKIIKEKKRRDELMSLKPADH
ncbi:MAG: DUF483 domain-containing protein [Candidatus Thermoplasmatota archaeon]|nr:DUF483 domain-containing protein [Candidatus Thermoplasmatota archaeon]